MAEVFLIPDVRINPAEQLNGMMGIVEWALSPRFAYWFNE
jgi:hypothetical protein